MTRHEAFRLLRDIAAADHRTVAETDVDVWHDCLDDVDFDDARAAVIEYFRTSTGWLMPAHVRTSVTRMRAARIAAVPQPDPGPELAGQPRDYAEALRAQMADIANARSVRTAIARKAPVDPNAYARAEIARITARAPHGPANARGVSPEERAAIQSAEFQAARKQLGADAGSGQESPAAGEGAA